VGLFVSHTGHHKHSYYVIRNSEHLTGFTDREVELIAQVARYHRKSTPRKKHLEFTQLGPEDQVRVRALAGLLRVAVGLDRTHGARVSGLSCHVAEDGHLVVEAAAVPGEDIQLELYAADQRTGLLEEVLGMPVEVVAAGTAGDGERETAGVAGAPPR
jgi:exopolyphosphatase/guanosine-5'-triphosphate,3'-diphosphate pyrophosphatase